MARVGISLKLRCRQVGGLRNRFFANHRTINAGEGLKGGVNPTAFLNVFSFVRTFLNVFYIFEEKTLFRAQVISSQSASDELDMEVREIRLKTFKNAFAATLGVSTCLAHSFRFVRRKEKAEKRPLFHVNVAGRVGK